MEGSQLDIFDVKLDYKKQIRTNRVEIQQVIRAILGTHSGAFIIFHYESGARWEWRFTFCHKGASQIDSTDAKRYTFLLGPGQSCRTAAENFMKLHEKIGHDGEFEMSDIIKAFDVEALSKEFFEKYKVHYGRFVGHVIGKEYIDKGDGKGEWREKEGLTPSELFYSLKQDEKRVRDYIKKLLGRIVFLHFLQKKGWLGATDAEWTNGPQDFMYRLYDKAFADATAAYQIQKRVAPELTPFLNFNPYWHGIEDLLHCTDFPTWLSDFAKNAGIPLLSYDMYGQMAPQPSGVEDYFNNLRLFSAAAEKAGADLWTTMLSVGHYHYRVPNEDDFRWQLNTAVASGVKGVMWFVVYAVNISNYRMAPFDEFGEKTATFEYLSRVNRHFLHQFGDFFLSAKRLSTTHYKQAFGGYPLFEAGKTDAQLTEITTEYGDLPAIVSFFEKDGKRYVALVNNSQKESALFHPHFSKTAGVREVTKLTWDGTFRDLRYNPSDVDFKETETEFILDSWLAPGQLDLYCIEQA